MPAATTAARNALLACDQPILHKQTAIQIIPSIRQRRSNKNTRNATPVLLSSNNRRYETSISITTSDVSIPEILTNTTFGYIANNVHVMNRAASLNRESNLHRMTSEVTSAMNAMVRDAAGI